MKTLTNIDVSSASKRKEAFGNLFSRVRNAFKNPKALGVFAHEAQKKTRIFLVDDDPLYLKALEYSISSNMGSLAISTFQTGEACLQSMKLKPSIVILDYYLNSEIPYAWNGVTILKQIKKISPRTKIIMISGQDSLNVAIDCMEKGAHDYVSKSRASLIRINNIVKNIVGNIEVKSTFYEIAQFILLLVVLALIASFIVSF